MSCSRKQRNTNANSTINKLTVNDLTVKKTITASFIDYAIIEAGGSPENPTPGAAIGITSTKVPPGYEAWNPNSVIIGGSGAQILTRGHHGIELMAEGVDIETREFIESDISLGVAKGNLNLQAPTIKLGYVGEKPAIKIIPAQPTNEETNKKDNFDTIIFNNLPKDTGSTLLNLKPGQLYIDNNGFLKIFNTTEETAVEEHETARKKANKQRKKEKKKKRKREKEERRA